MHCGLWADRARAACARQVKKTEVPVQMVSPSLSVAKLQELTEKEFEMALQARSFRALFALFSR